MPIKHNKTNTCGVISTLKGSWDISPDEMDSDFQLTYTFLSQPAILLRWVRQEDSTPYKGRSPHK